MATYYVWSGAGGTNAGTSWTNAYTAFGSAVTAASTEGDVILVHYTHQEELTVDTTYTFTANIQIVSVNKDASDSPALMGTGGWIGNSTTNRSIILQNANLTQKFYGITFRVSGTASDSIQIGPANGSQLEFESCYFWLGTTSTTARIQLGAGGSGGSSLETQLNFHGCTFRFGSTSQGFAHACHSSKFIDGSISSAGSAPSNLFFSNGTGYSELYGVDLSHVTGTLVADRSGGIGLFKFIQCKLGSGVTVLAAQTTAPNEGAGEVLVLDCASGDEHYHFGHYNALGSTIIDTSIYANDGAEYNISGTKHSWKIVTGSGASFIQPYRTPFISVYNEGTSAITPYLEAVRSGSSTKYNENELWSEWLVKSNSGSTNSELNQSDRGGVLASGTAQATGNLDATGWTGENATSAFMKLSPGSITPAEIGDLCARVCFSAASATVYVDPQIRGRT